MSFVTPDLLAKLGGLSFSEADECAFGVIRLDAAGKVMLCNRHAAELLGVKPNEAEGRRFFNELAPGTDNAAFRGRFEAGVAAGSMNQGFSYALFHRERSQLLDVHLIHHRLSQTYWVFLQARKSPIEPWREIQSSYEEQLAALYAERRPKPAAPPALSPFSLVPSGDDAPLRAEIEKLKSEKAVLQGEIQNIRKKARDIAAAMFEAALFGKKVTLPGQAAAVPPAKKKAG